MRLLPNLSDLDQILILNSCHCIQIMLAKIPLILSNLMPIVFGYNLNALNRASLSLTLKALSYHLHLYFAAEHHFGYLYIKGADMKIMQVNKAYRVIRQLNCSLHKRHTKKIFV